MKTQFIILIFIIIACCAVCSELQAQPFAEIRLRKHQFNNDVITTVDSIYRLWNNRRDITPTPGTSFKFTVGSDTVYYWKPIPGKKIKATITFAEDGVVIPPIDPPTGDDTTAIDGAKATFSGWATGVGQVGWYKKTIAFSNAPNSTATFTFTGTKVELWAERLPIDPAKPAIQNHGTGTVTVTRGSTVVHTQTVTFIGPKALPVLIYSSPTLQALPHTITLKVTSGYNLLDFFVVKNYVPSSGSIPPVDPPTGNIINVLPGDNLENKIRTAPTGSLVKISDGTFNTPNISVPVGVSIECSTGTIINGTTVGAVNTPVGVFEFKSDSKTNGNQTLTGCVIDGKNLVTGGIMVNNRDNVHIKNFKIRNTKFSGVWITNASNGSLSYFETFNTSWASSGWASGEINFSNITDYEIHHGTVNSDASNRGYGFKALYNKGTLTNTKFYNLRTNMHHTSIWNNGQSKNIGFEIESTTIKGYLEIYDCIFENQVSLAYGNAGDGSVTTVRNNIFKLEGDTYAVEAYLNDFIFKDNQIYDGGLWFANFGSAMHIKNWVVNNNIFANPAGQNPGWMAIILVGPGGIENANFKNNKITKGIIPLTKPLNVPGINMDASNIIM